jgi:arginase
MSEKICQVIGVASGFGAQIRACEEGPDTLKALGILKNFPLEILYPPYSAKGHPIPLKDSLPLICEINGCLSDKVLEVMNKGHFPIVIGGDHSIAVGTWNGVAQFLAKPFGLIWIDAHMDSHTPATTPSGAWHGMPLAALLGAGAKKLTELKQQSPILNPKNVCLIGTRSFEEGEWQLLQKLGVKVFFNGEVQKRGFDTVLKEAIALVTKETSAYGVSLDIDVIDPTQAPGVGSPEPEGIAALDLLKGLAILSRDPRLKAFELVEFNPQRDIANQTAHLCEQILSTVLSQGKPI